MPTSPPLPHASIQVEPAPQVPDANGSGLGAALRATAPLLAASVRYNSQTTQQLADLMACRNATAAGDNIDNLSSSVFNLGQALLSHKVYNSLPPELFTGVSAAWTATYSAGTALNQLSFEAIGRCTPGNTKGKAYKAFLKQNAKAQALYSAMVGEWNPLAAKHGLRQYKTADFVPQMRGPKV